jgi:RNA polymerase sigma-70 factor (ECF subfamily)
MTSSLLTRVAHGDSAATRACVDQFGPLIWSMARRYTRGQADAEDAVQDIFVSLWRSAGRFDPDRSSEAAFVAMIARRRLIDLRRAGATRIDDPREPGAEKEWGREAEGDVVGELESALSARVEAERIQTALSELRSEQREILLLSTVNGLTQSEIARQTGLPLGTVKAHARRGLLRLRELFALGRRAGKEGAGS